MFGKKITEQQKHAFQRWFVHHLYFPSVYCLHEEGDSVVALIDCVESQSVPEKHFTLMLTLFDKMSGGIKIDLDDVTLISEEGDVFLPDINSTNQILFRDIPSGKFRFIFKELSIY